MELNDFEQTDRNMPENVSEVASTGYDVSVYLRVVYSRCRASRVQIAAQNRKNFLNCGFAQLCSVGQAGLGSLMDCKHNAYGPEIRVIGARRIDGFDAAAL